MCKSCEQLSMKARYTNNPIPQMLSNAKIRAREKNIPFEIDSSYLKEIFPKDEDEPKLLLTIILIQLVAIFGAIVLSKVSKMIGNIPTLIWAVLLWVGICISAYFVNTQIQFYFLAGVVGLVMGGIQTMSRSTYSKLLPPTEDNASYFSFYDVTEKVALTLGLMIFARNEELTGSIRNSILVLMCFFILAFFSLLYTRKAITKEKYADLHP